MFFAIDGDVIVLLLAGYDKGKDPSDKRQQKEIKAARKKLADHLEQQRERDPARGGAEPAGPPGPLASFRHWWIGKARR